MAPAIDQLVAGAVFGTGAAMTYLLARVPPDPRGHGTHELLGMPPCSWPATLQAPCPTCGVTTAAAHLVHLQPVTAVVTQPFGAALAAVGLWLALLAGFSLLTRRSFVDRVVRLPYGTMATVGLVLLLGSWLYKYLTFAS